MTFELLNKHQQKFSYQQILINWPVAKHYLSFGLKSRLLIVHHILIKSLSQQEEIKPER